MVDTISRFRVYDSNSREAVSAGKVSTDRAKLVIVLIS